MNPAPQPLDPAIDRNTPLGPRTIPLALPPHCHGCGTPDPHAGIANCPGCGEIVGE